MFLVFGKIILLLAAILIVCLWFTNAVENLGVRLKLGEQVVGSLLAAIGTALPETLLPIIAIMLAGVHSQGDPKTEIAIGSIIGAPFLLSTLALFLLGLAVLVNYQKRKNLDLKVCHKHITKDLSYFLLALLVAVSATFFQTQVIKTSFAVVLVAIYVIYFITTLREGSEAAHDEAEDDVDQLYISSFSVAGFRLPSNLFWMIFQLFLSLAGIVVFAHEFILEIEKASMALNVSPLILSLIIAPIATELPEKVNSWFWASSGKDGLALGNITGAMVFQSAIPCAVGVSLTPWNLDSHTIFCVILTILSASIMLFSLKVFKKVHAATLTFMGFLYLLYLVAIILF
ncbi:MAG: hypothetical protein MK033_00190 [Candidatus Caenarcaniphilales bacterium]|nr:hypothetical protein [Candidatus Caenarcaniphilales bacterium]